MQQKIENGVIFLKTASKEEDAKVKKRRLFKQDKKTGFWYSECSRTALEWCKEEFGLIPPAQKELNSILYRQKVVDEVRVLDGEKLPKVVKPPINGTLFQHQTRAVIMALLTFGLLDPKEVHDGIPKD